MNFCSYRKKLDRNTELARAVDVMMARAKRIYILMIKLKVFPVYSLWCFVRVSIEL